MKIYKNIQQQTDEWKELKYRKIGGSTLGGVMSYIDKPVEGNAIFFELLGQFTEEFEIDEDGNNYVEDEKEELVFDFSKSKIFNDNFCDVIYDVVVPLWEKDCLVLLIVFPREVDNTCLRKLKEKITNDKKKTVRFKVDEY